MQGTLIHIGQLRHGVGFPGEEEALLLLLIEKGIDPFHPKLMVHPLTVRAAQAHLLRRLRAVHQSVCRAGKGTDAEENLGLDAHRLVQIEILKYLSVQTDGEHAGTVAVGDPGIAGGLPGYCLRGQSYCNGGGFIKALGILGPLRRHAAKALKSNLIQIPDHGWFLPKNNNRVTMVTLLLYIRKLKMANTFLTNPQSLFIRK